MIRTRYAPSPTGYMHCGNLRTALYEYLIAKSAGGQFVLRIEDTDQSRQVDGAVEVIYDTLRLAGLQHDEGPDIGGPFAPYVQSERKNGTGYLNFAQELVAKGEAYYCFCTKERLETLQKADAEGVEGVAQYDRHCTHLSKEEIEENLKNGVPYVVRQLIPEGRSTFVDEVYGEISIDNAELDDQVLIKSDGMPTYNFANVVDDHLMEITHVVRGSEYLSSTPKYNLLYDAFGWKVPTYVHLPLVLNENGAKLSKRKGDATFADLLNQGYLPEAIINYCALLGWAPSDNREIFSMAELVEAFDVKGLSKSPSSFDTTKLAWMNGEYFKKMDADVFFDMAAPVLAECVKREGLGMDAREIAAMVQPRIRFLHEIPGMLDFIDCLPDYDIALYTHKKMKTNADNALESLQKCVPVLEAMPEADWTNEGLYARLQALAEETGVKNGVILWPVRTALSGKETTPCGASELLVLFGKEESMRRIQRGIEKLQA